MCSEENALWKPGNTPETRDQLNEYLNQKLEDVSIEDIFGEARIFGDYYELPEVDAHTLIKQMLKSFETVASSSNTIPRQVSLNEDRLFNKEMCCSVIDAAELAKLCQINWAFFWNNTFKTDEHGNMQQLHLPVHRDFQKRTNFLEILCHAADLACDSVDGDEVVKDVEVERDNQDITDFVDDRIFDSLPAFGDDTDENLLELEEHTKYKELSELDEFEEIVSQDLYAQFQRSKKVVNNTEEYDDDDDDDKFDARGDNIYRDMQVDDNDGKKNTMDVEEGSESLKEKLTMMEKYADVEMKKDEIFALVKVLLCMVNDEFMKVNNNDCLGLNHKADVMECIERSLM